MALLKPAALVLLSVVVLIPVSVSRADDIFSLGYTPGSIQGQKGWSGGPLPITANLDQGITTAAAHTGSQSWLISNYSAPSAPVPFGIFGGMPFSPSLSVNAAQPSSGAGADTFQATFWFKTADTTAGDGSYIQFDLGDPNGDGRNTFLGIENKPDDQGGLVFRADESVDTSEQFLTTQTVASNLDRTTWHKVVLTGHFLNGDGNDYFTISLDGTPLINPDSADPSPNVGTPDYFTFEGYQNFNNLTYELTSRMFFDASLGGSAFSDESDPLTDTSPQGFYVDDLSYEAFNSSDPSDVLSSFTTSFETPEPASLVLIVAGGLCMVGRGRRNKN